MASANKRDAGRTIGAVIAHPLRARCLTALAERTASPAELASEFRMPLSDVSYHVATLLKAGAIELVAERPVRGSIQHFYRAVASSRVDRAASAALPLEQRLASARLAFQLAAADATVALDAQTFGRRPEAEAARLPMVLDEDGWVELADLCAETVERMLAVRAASERRRAEGGGGAGASGAVRAGASGDGGAAAKAADGGERDGERGIPVTAFLTFFERPPL